MADGISQVRDSLIQSSASGSSRQVPASAGPSLLSCEIDKHAAALGSEDPAVRQGAMRELMEFAREHKLGRQDVAAALRGFRARERSGPGDRTDAHDLACISDGRTLNNAGRGAGGASNHLLDGLRSPG